MDGTDTSPRLLPRARLLARVGDRPVIVAEAPGGYGKSALAWMLAEAGAGVLVRIAVPTRPGPAEHEDDGMLLATARRAFAEAGVRHTSIERSSDVAALLDALRVRLHSPGPRLVVLVDDLHLAGPGAVALAGGLREIVADPGQERRHTLVLAGRSIPDALLVSGIDHGREIRLGAAELAFDDDETLALLRASGAVGDDPGASHDAETLRAALGGWPAAIGVALGVWGARAAWLAGVRSHHEVVIDTLIRRLVDRIDDHAARAAVVAAGQLPTISVEIADALGAQTWATLRAAGLPMAPVDPGGRSWWRVADPVRDALSRLDPLRAEQRWTAASAYVQAGRVREALDLLASGRPGPLARLIADLDGNALERLELAELRAMLRLLEPGRPDRADRPGPTDRPGHPDRPGPPDHQARAPHVASGARGGSDDSLWAHLQLARLAALTGDIGEHVAGLDRLRDRVGDALDSPLQRAIAAERVRYLARGDGLDDAVDLGTRVLAACEPTELRTRARCLAGVGLAEASRSSPGSVARATAALTEAVSLARALGERGLEAGALHWLGYWVQYSEGNASAAVSAQRQAMALLEPGDRRRGQMATFLAEILVAVGRPEEAQGPLDEARRIGSGRGDTLTLAYVGWVEAERASHGGDVDALAAHLRTVQRHRGPWFDHSTGTDFLAATVEMWRRVERPEEAAGALTEIEGRPRGSVPVVEIAEGAHHVWCGDPAYGDERLRLALGSAGLRPISRPRILLFRAWSAARLGERASAAAHLADAFRTEESLGAHGMLAVTERQAVRAVQELLDRAGSRSRVLPTPGPTGAGGRAKEPGTVTVSLLGGLAVRRGDDVLHVPPGQGRELVCRLAVADHPLSVDEIVDRFWPESSLDSGRRRLRNLLNRIRESAGEIVVRTGDALTLPTGSEVDAHQFVHEATTALRGPADVTVLEHALTRYRGQLLPDDLYSDWTLHLRERCDALAVALLRTLASLADGADDANRALLYLQRVVEVQPYDEEHYISAGRAALAAGQRGLARSLLERGRAVADELGVSPNPALLELLGTI